jgi:hypothetical protein
MDTHFHYYCIRVLAEKAGFSPAEAETLAYASQYVDDATEHKPVRVADPPPEAEAQHIAGRFDPVCTAHAGLQYLSAGNPDIQRKVYIPFHFVPDRVYTSGAYDYCVRAGGGLAAALLDAALIGLLDAAADGPARAAALVRTGIALHTFADTWAHQGFSGRHNAADNDIQDRARFEAGEWREVGLIERAAWDAFPDIGHAEAGEMADQAFLRWRYRRVATGQVVERDNTGEFFAAANAIAGRLRAAMGVGEAGVPAGVAECLAVRGGAREVWSARFPEVFAGQPDYDAQAWRRAALRNGRVDWDEFGSAEEFAAENYEYAGDPRWFMFHEAAGLQRDFVLRRIRFDLA